MHLKLLQKKEATDNLIGNKIGNNITKVSKNSPQNTLETVESKTEILREIHISPEERQKIIDNLRLI